MHKLEWAIVKLRPTDGAVLDRIDVPRDYPEIHGLSRDDGGFLYCDATSGWIVKITL